MKRKISLQFGAMVPRLAEQLKEHQINPEDLERYQAIADAITTLWVHDFIQESGLRVLRDKLAKLIIEDTEAPSK